MTCHLTKWLWLTKFLFFWATPLCSKNSHDKHESMIRIAILFYQITRKIKIWKLSWNTFWSTKFRDIMRVMTSHMIFDFACYLIEQDVTTVFCFSGLPQFGRKLHTIKHEQDSLLWKSSEAGIVANLYRFWVKFWVFWVWVDFVSIMNKIMPSCSIK